MSPFEFISTFQKENPNSKIILNCSFCPECKNIGSKWNIEIEGYKMTNGKLETILNINSEGEELMGDGYEFTNPNKMNYSLQEIADQVVAIALGKLSKEKIVSDYLIMRYADHWDLTFKIKELIKEGWFPVGNLVFDNDHFCQVVVKFEGE